MQQRHQDVAAYALGVLEPADAFRFEEHLAECVMCAVQLSDFTSVAASLAELAGTRAGRGLVLSPRLLDRLTGEVAAERRRSRRRRLQLVAAAAALIVALPVAAVALRGGGSGPAGQRVEATDAKTGVTASAALQDRQWGTAVSLHLTASQRAAHLLAGRRRQERHRTPGAQLGGAGGRLRDARGHPGTRSRWTSRAVRIVPSGEIARWEVRAADGQPLVTLGG